MFEELRGRKPSLIDMGSYRRSAVVIPLIKTESGYEVLFEVRAIGLKHQPGEICFPGGGCNRDEAAEAAARREICEELLLSPEQIRLFRASVILPVPQPSSRTRPSSTPCRFKSVTR